MLQVRSLHKNKTFSKNLENKLKNKLKKVSLSIKRKLSKQKNVSAHKSIRFIDEIVKDLSPAEYDLPNSALTVDTPILVVPIVIIVYSKTDKMILYYYLYSL